MQWIVALGAMVILAGAARSEEVPPPRTLGCIPIDAVAAEYTARDLAGVVRACVDAGRSADAVALFITYNSFALFDQQRVRDTSAHLVLQDLNLWVLSGYDREQMSALKSHLAVFKDRRSEFARRVCAALWQMGPPDYRPSYMIVQGQMPRRHAEDWRTEGFDPRAAWTRAVSGVNGCPKPH